MGKLTQRYRDSGWYETFNLSTEDGRARSSLLAARIPQAIISGFTSGVFYSGLLLGYGINIVNISILTTIPYLASLLTVFTPYILGRFRKRRFIISAARICYYLINIVGITLLPVLVKGETARIWGLILITFSANAINYLFEGYNPWHMPYIVPSVRDKFLTGTTLVSNISGSIVLLVTSAITDSVHGDARLTLISCLRYAAFGIALLDVWFLSRPKEPDYTASSPRPSLLDVFRKPLQDKSFRLTMLVFVLLQFAGNLTAASLNTWLLQNVQVSYLYTTSINSTFFLFVLLISPFWSRMIRRFGCTRIMIVSELINAFALIAYAFVNHGNYLWLMTFVRLTQHIISMGQSLSTNAMLYENLPAKDQTAHLSFYMLICNLSAFLSMTVGTWILAAVETKSLIFLGTDLCGVPLLLILRAFLYGILTAVALVLRKKVEPNRRFR